MSMRSKRKLSLFLDSKSPIVATISLLLSISIYMTFLTSPWASFSFLLLRSKILFTPCGTSFHHGALIPAGPFLSVIIAFSFSFSLSSSFLKFKHWLSQLSTSPNSSFSIFSSPSPSCFTSRRLHSSTYLLFASLVACRLGGKIPMKKIFLRSKFKGTVRILVKKLKNAAIFHWSSPSGLSVHTSPPNSHMHLLVSPSNGLVPPPTTQSSKDVPDHCEHRSTMLPALSS
mmetsp:Transcript_23351/g.48600  ORF Transcript_23351/g.48600 Transcript_23351/m.48600 type:complete len:229 (+) Transcript_23351:1050-1736(+)